MATSKGIIAGNLVYLDGDGKIIDCSKSMTVSHKVKYNVLLKDGPTVDSVLWLAQGD